VIVVQREKIKEQTARPALFLWLNGIPGRAVHVLDEALLVDHDDRGRDGVEHLIRRFLEVLHLLCFFFHLGAQSGKGGFELRVHAVEFDRQLFQLISRVNLDRLLQFSSPDEARGLLQSSDGRHNPAGREIP